MIRRLGIKGVRTISRIPVERPCFLCLFLLLSVCLSVSVCLSICPSVCLSLSLSICLLTNRYLSVCVGLLPPTEIRIPFEWPVNCERALRSGIRDTRPSSCTMASLPAPLSLCLTLPCRFLSLPLRPWPSNAPFSLFRRDPASVETTKQHWVR